MFIRMPLLKLLLASALDFIRRCVRLDFDDLVQVALPETRHIICFEDEGALNALTGSDVPTVFYVNPWKLILDLLYIGSMSVMRRYP